MAVTKYSSSETAATAASQVVVTEEKQQQTQQTADSQVRSSSIIMDPYSSTSTFLSSSSLSCSSTACCDDTESEKSTSSSSTTDESSSSSSSSSANGDDDDDQENATSSPTTTATDTSTTTDADALRPSKVRFSTVEIREHNMTMGDNPSVSSGIPVTIEWNHANEFVCDLDVYEKLRPKRRGRYELVLPRSHRTNVCYQSAGYSRSEIIKQVKVVSVTKNERRRSIQYQRLDALHEFVEKSCRATMNMTVRKKTKQEERQYIQNAMTQQHTVSTRRSSV
mmetsp:Transcript_30223/g.73507  ORF Transcript_30223/g.73507 Transcript_30223/m.73507 type:complete len:280 (-) Transcript_30223:247-1086(-)|eukprot:CAMPEP_0113453032 /NCGR_PEP_ID=MMETSP0014_2-20120614/7151_1 /TAXON_ID=2857 /ORGANISM="Nitzschia sp." /LENGTH=279 /DNA_ID=CAMNT_0000344419 /DNA_START=55 /DNA_END=894 /DNA_ORIENTATION=- /assembly_acc=CAM_ASM_000159